MCPFHYTNFEGVRRWARKPVNHTSRVAVVTQTDRPKSARNRCVIEQDLSQISSFLYL